VGRVGQGLSRLSSRFMKRAPATTGEAGLLAVARVGQDARAKKGGSGLPAVARVGTGRAQAGGSTGSGRADRTNWFGVRSRMNGE
jgi:hypothetical protein